MSISIVSLSGGNNTIPAPYFSLLKGGSVAINDGLTLTYTNDASGEASGASTQTAGSGDASWVPAEAVQGGHYNTSNSAWVVITMSGATPGALFNIRGFSSFTASGGRITEWRVNGGASQELSNEGPNLTNDVRFNEAEADASGNVTIEYKEAGSSSGSAYANALYIEDFNPSPAVTLTNPPQLGATLSGTGTNYAAQPTGPISITQGARSLPDMPITVSAWDAATGSFNWTTNAALPGFPANAADTTPFVLTGENVTITLPDPGA